MGPRHGNPKTALEVFGTIAAGGSLGGICLLAEERRRRIALAQKIIENGKRLQAHKSYQALAPLDTFDPSSIWDGHLLSPADRERQRQEQQVRQAEHLPLLPEPQSDTASLKPHPRPQAGHQRQLSSIEWRTRSRKHRPIPQASPITLHTASPPEEVQNGWFPNKWLDTQERDASSQEHGHILPVNEAKSKDQNPADGFSFTTNDGSTSTEQQLRSGTAESYQGPMSTVATPTSHAPTIQSDMSHSSPAEIISTQSKVPTPKISEYAEGLERIVAHRIIACLETRDKTWIGRGVIELKSYFQEDRHLLTSDMEHAISLASARGHIPKKSTGNNRSAFDHSRLRAVWMELPAKKAIPWASICTEVTDSLQSQSRSILEAPQGLRQDIFATQIHDLVEMGRANEAYLVFRAFCDNAVLPLHKNMRLAISSLLEAFTRSGLFSIVSSIRQDCLQALKEWRFVVDEFQWMLRFQPSSQLPQFVQKIHQSIMVIDLQGSDRHSALQEFEKSVKWIEKGGSVQTAIDLHLTLLQRSTPEDKARMLYTTTRLFKAALQDDASDQAMQLATFGLLQESGPNHTRNILDVSIRSQLSAYELERAQRLVQSAMNRSGEIVEGIDADKHPGTSGRILADVQVGSTGAIPATSGSADTVYELSKLHATSTVIEDYKTLSVAKSCESLSDRAKNLISQMLAMLDSMLPQVWAETAGAQSRTPSSKPASSSSSVPRMLEGALRIAQRYKEMRDIEAELRRLLGRETLAFRIRQNYQGKKLWAIRELQKEGELPTDLPMDCRLMALHARTQNDADAMLDVIKKHKVNLDILPHQALRHLLDVTDQEVKLTALDIYLSRRGDTEANEQILDLWNTNNELIKSRGPTALALVWQSYAESGPVNQAIDFLDAFPLDHKYHSALVIDAHVKLLSRCWRLTRSLPTTKALMEKQILVLRGSTESLDLFNKAILACVEANVPEAAQRIADQISELGLVPDIETYSHQMLAEARMRRWDLVTETFARLQSEGLSAPVKAYHFDRVFFEHVEQHSAEESLTFVQRMLGEHISNVAARCVADAIIVEQRDDLLAKWFEIIGAFRPRRAFSHSALRLMVFKVLQSAKLKYSSSIALLSFEDIAECKSADELLALVNQDRGDETPQPGAIGSMLGRSSRDQARQTEQTLLRDLEVSGPEKTLATYHESQRPGVPPSDVDLRIAIKAVTLLGKPKAEWHKLARRLIAKARRSGLDVAPAELYLETMKLRDSEEHLSEGKATSMLQAYHNGASSRHKTTSHLATALAGNLIRHDKPQAALRIMQIEGQRVQAAGGELGIAAYTTMAQAFISMRQTEGVVWVVRQILEKDLTIDAQVIRNLISEVRKLEHSLRRKQHFYHEETRLAAFANTLRQAVATLRQRRDEQRSKAFDFARNTAQTMVKYTGGSSRRGRTANQDFQDPALDYGALRAAAGRGN